ncbi:MAG: hypothetical protein AB1391_03145 [Candidatus Micrarchaeota archaeon]
MIDKKIENTDSNINIAKGAYDRYGIHHHTATAPAKACKGFMNSLITLLIAALLIELIFGFQLIFHYIVTAHQSVSAIKYAEYYFDDIAYDLTHLTSDNPMLYRINASYVGISFTSAENISNFTGLIDNYTQKLRQQAPKFNGNFTIDISNVSSNGMTYNFSNGVVFIPGYETAEKTKLLSSPHANFTNYTISFSTDLIRDLIGDFNYSGLPNDRYVKINITDANGTYLSEGFISRHGNNEFNVTYTTGAFFKIFIKKIEDNDGSFYVLKNSIPNSIIAVDVIMKNDGEYPVYVSIPIYLNITTPDYSKYGTITPMKV